MYRSSVEKSTKGTYKTAERRWVKLTRRIGTDPYMRTKSSAWLGVDLSFAHTTITWAETCVLAFLLESTRHKPPKIYAVYQQHEGCNENCIPNRD